MTATKTDYQVASLAAGFSLGFGFLTAWEAIKQTRRNKSPLRSSYIYMIGRPPPPPPPGPILAPRTTALLC